MSKVIAEFYGAKLIELKIYKDERGFFLERYNQTLLKCIGLTAGDFVQDNHSRSNPGVLRGLHYQLKPAQGKLVGVTHGKIWDLILDIRPESEGFGKTAGFDLNDENGHLLWIPAGFAHGFIVLSQEPADLLYKVTAAYDPKAEAGIYWNDPDLKINWPKPAQKNAQNSIQDSMFLVSERDKKLPSWSAYCRAQAK